MNQTSVCIVGIDNHTDTLVKYLINNNYNLYLVLDDQTHLKEKVLYEYKCFFESTWDQSIANKCNIVYISYIIPNDVFLSIVQSSVHVVMDITTALFYFEQNHMNTYIQSNTSHIYSNIRLDKEICKVKDSIRDPTFIQINCIDEYPVHSIEYELDLLLFLTNQKPRYIYSTRSDNIWTTTLQYQENSDLVVVINKISSLILKPSKKISIMMKDRTIQHNYSYDKKIPGMHSFDLHDNYYNINIEWLFNCTVAIQKSCNLKCCIDVEKEIFRE